MKSFKWVHRGERVSAVCKRASAFNIVLLSGSGENKLHAPGCVDKEYFIIHDFVKKKIRS